MDHHKKKSVEKSPLNGLDDINWADMRHACGSAANVPDLLRGVMSPGQTSTNAMDELGTYLWCHGRVYEATVHAIPFLIKILQLPDQGIDKAYILLFLADFANAYSEPGTEWAMKAHNAVRDGLPIMIDMLQHEREEIREDASSALLDFPEDVLIIAPKMQETIQMYPDPVSKAAIIVNLGKLLLSSRATSETIFPAYHQFFEALFRNEVNSAARLAAALSLARISKGAIFDDAVELMVTSLSSDNYPPLDLYETLKGMEELETEQGTQALIQVLQSATDYKRVHDFARSLLILAFGKKSIQPSVITSYSHGGKTNSIYYRPLQPLHEPSSRNILTEHQRRTVETLLNNELFWEIKTNLLELCGVPQDRGELRTFLENQAGEIH